MGRKPEKETKKRFSRGLLPVIMTLIAIPIVLHQSHLEPENVKLAGRICAGAALLLLIAGLVRNIVKIFALTLAALILIMILATEGVIDLPKIFSP